MSVPTIAEIKRWAGDNYQRHLALAIAIDARGVYDFLKANSLLGANWTKGYEQTETAKLQMATILNKAALKSGNAMNYIKAMRKALPNPVLAGNYKAQQNITRLLRNNP